MMIDTPPKYLSGVLAVGIYLSTIALLVWYFNVSGKKKPKHYVKKNEQRIQVALAPPINIVKKKVIEAKVPKSKPVVKPKPKKIVKEKLVKKKLVKKKIVKKKKPLHLFDKVKTPKKKNTIQVSDKSIKSNPKKNIIKDKPLSASQRITDALKNQKISDRGEVNVYYSKVEAMLEAWPARSDFLGEHALVTLFIEPTGKFEYEVTSASANEDFAKSVVDFLKQLQNIGFGTHNAGRTYEFEVKFSTKK